MAFAAVSIFKYQKAIMLQHSNNWHIEINVNDSQ